MQDVGNCGSCLYFDLESPSSDRVETRIGWGYCQMMTSRFITPDEPRGVYGENLETLAVGVDAEYGRGDRIEVLVSPVFGCVMFAANERPC